MPLTTVSQGLLSTDAQYTGFKNRIINGDMGVWQRATSSTAQPGYVSVDRFGCINTSNFSRSTDVPTGFQYSLEFASSSATFPVAYQRIESANCVDLAGQQVTLSFWAKNISGASTIFSECFYANSVDNFSSTTALGNFQASAANPSSSWTFYSGTITLPAQAANGIEIRLVRSSTAAATTRITGVQLEKGNTATSFDYLPYGTELNLCQRYYQTTSWYEFTSVNATIPFVTTMRTSPTATFTNPGWGTNVSNVFGAFDNSIFVSAPSVVWSATARLSAEL